MKRFLITAAACMLAGTLAIGTAASAQPYGYAHHDRDRGDHDRGYRSENYRSDNHSSDNYRSENYRHNDYRGNSYRHDTYRPVVYRGWHDRSDWRRGGYVGRSDWDRGYHVNYSRYHLRRPPYGYEWRRVNNDYVLAAIATGLIADIIGR